MRILVNGVNTINKGAELMFYAVLQEIESKYPDAEVIFNGNSIPDNYFCTSLRVRVPFLCRLFYRLRLGGIIRVLFKRIVTPAMFSYKNVDFVFDVSGYLYHDMIPPMKIASNLFCRSLKNYFGHQAKIVFLPQAFGPFNHESSQNVIKAINQYADIIVAREKASYNYTLEMIGSTEKLWQYPDLTIKVSGVIPKEIRDKSNYVTIIPNLRMVDQGKYKRSDYLEFLISATNICKSYGREVYIINHESSKDARLCKDVAENCQCEVITGLNALEIKGFISKSYFTISSRYHGAVNSLSTGVPCLATSWSHKYEMLFADYDQVECILDIRDTLALNEKIKIMMNEELNIGIRTLLFSKNVNNVAMIDDMWRKIWDNI